MDKRKVIYYTDELNDEFSLAEITPRVIDKSYVYDHTSIFKKFTRVFWYWIVFFPIAFFYVKIKFHHKVVNQRVIKPYKKSGYFLYGNHTQDIGDAFLPQQINRGKDKYIIVHPNNVSMPVLGKLTPSLGAIPLPDDMQAYKSFIKVIDKRIKQKKCVVVYPEAHIWPFYTGIRPFPDTSFQYPIKNGVPAFCFTNTYQKRKFSKKPKIVTYVDGPFLTDPALPMKEARADLRNRIYECMCKRAQCSQVEWIKYIKKENSDD